MKRFILVLLITATPTGVAYAQSQPTAPPAVPRFNMTFTSRELSIIYNGLNELPRKLSEPVVESINRQLNAAAAKAEAQAAKKNDAAATREKKK